MECLSRLVGIRELCAEDSVQPLFWLDDAEAVDRVSLSQIAKRTTQSGLQFGKDIIESSARIIIADIESLIPKGYTIKTSLNSFCNTCTWTALSTASPFTGIVGKNNSKSLNSYLSLDSIKVRIAQTGTFTIVLDDDILPKTIQHSFTAGTETAIVNINYKTAARSVKIYFLEAGVLVYALSCPTSKSCGCSGQTAQSKDITVKGLLNNAETTTQYGFIPCFTVVCSVDNIICNIINQQPRIFALALFYRSTARYFKEYAVTERNNRNASHDKEEKSALEAEYMSLYYERLRGSSQVKGISDNMKSALDNLKDDCVECKRLTGISWGAG